MIDPQIRTTGKVLGVVPARGGSKSLPRKNLRLLDGHPLIAYSIACGITAHTIDRLIVSTDDSEIADVARQYGAEVPYLRPTNLALDDTPDLPVFQHLLAWLSEHEGYMPEIVVHLRPTCPLRSVDHVNRSVELLRANPAADSVRTVIPPLENPYKMWTIPDGTMQPLLKSSISESFNMPRQLLPAVYWHNGYVDAFRRQTIENQCSMTGNRILPLVLDSSQSIDIDTEFSLTLAECLIRNGHANPIRPQHVDGIAHVMTAFESIKLLVLDCDGVMTDNRVILLENGVEASAFNRSDGLGLARLSAAGMGVLVLSSEAGNIASLRCQKLHIDCLVAVQDKLVALIEWVQARGIYMEEVVYVGNDINDLSCMRAAAVGVAVADAHPLVLREAEWVLVNAGGAGAVREICDLLLGAMKQP